HHMLTLLPKEREKIIEFVLDNPEKEIKVRELAALLKISPAHVCRTLKILAEHGIIKRGDNVVDLSNPYVRMLKVLFNIKKLIDGDVIGRLKRLGAMGAGIYGSWATGTNREDSDLDIWIKVGGNPGEMKVAAISSEIRRALGRNVQILVLTPKRIERLREGDPIFYYSLVFGSIRLYGEAIE
ncbi:MAG: nucleotidyltransferase domain-containing protein, partial [Candidatus Bathyarchaeia archaeon]